MTTFEPGDFVWVPFPFVEEAKTVHRPAMVLTTRPLGPASSLGWVIMVTNALRPGWPGDIDVTTWREAGLKIPSKIRTEKISTVDLTGVVPVGKADANLLESVRQKVTGFLV